MALFAMAYAFQATGYDSYHDFAYRQLQYGALLEQHLTNVSEDADPRDRWYLTVGRDLRYAYAEFQNYLKAKNISTIYDYLYSMARITCQSEYFVGHLIRYGRICQVRKFSTSQLT